MQKSRKSSIFILAHTNTYSLSFSLSFSLALSLFLSFPLALFWFACLSLSLFYKDSLRNSMRKNRMTILILHTVTRTHFLSCSLALSLSLFLSPFLSLFLSLFLTLSLSLSRFLSLFLSFFLSLSLSLQLYTKQYDAYPTHALKKARFKTQPLCVNKGQFQAQSNSKGVALRRKERFKHHFGAKSQILNPLYRKSKNVFQQQPSCR